VDAAKRDDARDPASSPDDDPPADLLAEDAVRRADVAGALRRDRRRLQAEPMLPDRSRGLVHDGVVRLASRLEREIETGKLEREAGYIGCQNAQRLFEQFLPGFVSLEHDDRVRVHGERF
jgi:hypothetical protein